MLLEAIYTMTACGVLVLLLRLRRDYLVRVDDVSLLLVLLCVLLAVVCDFVFGYVATSCNL